MLINVDTFKMGLSYDIGKVPSHFILDISGPTQRISSGESVYGGFVDKLMKKKELGLYRASECSGRPKTGRNRFYEHF